uniref:Capsid protein n=1 Tax=Xanthophyllomyces dendrorhous virus L2 TaxID=1167692 RepID=H9XW63_9VIRU|nr:capsid protein [Xanthophyllomyces dendrorhous virus L2]
MEGEAMVTDMDAHDFVLDETKTPRKALFSGAMINYLAFMGLHAILSNYASRHENWRSAFLHSHEELAILHDRTVRAALTSVITGKEMVTFMNPNLFVSYDVTPMVNVSKVSFEEVLERGYPSSLPVHGVVPMVSGSLFLSANASDVASQCHLEQGMKVTVDEYGTVSPEDALRVAQMYRMFGHELEIRSEKTEEIHELFAPVQECVIYPSALLYNTRDTDRLKLVSSLRRPGRSSTIPDVSALTAGQTITIDYTIPRIGMHYFNKRVLPIAPSMVLPQRKREITFRVKGHTVLHKVKMNASNVTRPVKDFHGGEIQVAPLLPVLRNARVPIQVNQTSEEDVTAEDVE